MKVTKRDYANALFVQDGCNISGIIKSLNEVLDRINEDTRELGEEARRNHPIITLYVDKLNDLCGRIPFEKYSEAYGQCENQSIGWKEENVEGKI